MLQQFLYQLYICPFLNECRGEIVTKAMGVQIYPSTLRPFPKFIAYRTWQKTEDTIITSLALYEPCKPLSEV